MSNLTPAYDLNKKGTFIITIGRSGSHLLGDVLFNHLSNITNTINLREFFLNYTDPLTKINGFYNSKLSNLRDHTLYTIVQVQDFQSKLWLLRNLSKIQDYHIVILRRRDQLEHFFSRQVLLNFYDIIPAHTIVGQTDEIFSKLVGKQLTIDESSVWQFYSELELLNRFAGDSIYYEDMLSWDEITSSKYVKNVYPITYEELFTNYDDIVEHFTNDQ